MKHLLTDYLHLANERNKLNRCCTFGRPAARVTVWRSHVLIVRRFLSGEMTLELAYGENS